MELMRNALSLAALLLLNWAMVSGQSGQRQLVFVQAVFRHGDRAPSDIYPNDQYDASYWPRGLSQLTNEGMQQTKGLGQFIRNRYGKATDNFLSMDYKLEEIYIRSTDEDRALTSAQAMLAGLYPPQGQQVWDPSIAWQPIPVHSATPDTEDLLLKPTSVVCPEYDRIYLEENSNLFNDYNIRYKDFFASVGQMTGLPGLNMSTIDDVYTVIYRERTHNLTQPAWVDQMWNGTSAYDLILEMKRVNRIADFNSPRKSKILGGFLLADFVQRMQKKAAGTLKSPEKMVLYSAHDGTVTSLMYAMKIGNELLTPYAAALILELYRTPAGSYEVDVLYRNDTDMVTPFVMQVPGCPANAGCPLQTFATIMAPEMVTSRGEFDQLCKVNQPVATNNTGRVTENIFLDILRNITNVLFGEVSNPSSRY